MPPLLTCANPIRECHKTAEIHLQRTDVRFPSCVTKYKGESFCSRECLLEYLGAAKQPFGHEPGMQVLVNVIRVFKGAGDYTNNEAQYASCDEALLHDLNFN